MVIVQIISIKKVSSKWSLNEFRKITVSVNTYDECYSRNEFLYFYNFHCSQCAGEVYLEKLNENSGNSSIKWYLEETCISQRV